MSTLGDIADQASQDILNRTAQKDIDQGVKLCRNAYMVITGKIPFPELETKSAEISTVANDPEVDLGTLNPTLAGILSIRYSEQATQNKRRLVARDTRQFDAAASTIPSNPYAYARFGKKIELFPPPDNANDTVRVRYWGLPTFTDPQDLSELRAHTILFPFEWEELLLWETVYRLHHYFQQYNEAMMLVSPSIMPDQAGPSKPIRNAIGMLPSLWNNLLQTVRAREYVDADYAVNPIYHPYTNMSGRR